MKRVLNAVLLLAMSVGAAFGAQPANPSIVIYAGELLAVPGRPPLARQSIVVKDGKVVEVRPGYVDPNSLGTDTVLYDLSKQFVLPGLTDMHVHLTGNLNLAGAGVTRPAVTIGLEGAGAAQRILLSGFTTVRDVGSPDDIIFPLRDAIKGGLVVGPRLFSSGRSIAGTGGHALSFCDGVESCRKLARERIKSGADLIKIAPGGGGGDPSADLDVPEMFPDEIEAIVDTARQHGRIVAAHAHSAAAINAALRAGVRTIEHGTNFDQTSIKLFHDTGAILVPTTSVRDTVYNSPVIMQSMSPAERARMEEHLKQQLTVTGRAYKAGIKMALGTDTGTESTTNRAKELTYYVQNGVPASEALKAATVTAAEALGMSGSLGQIKAGFAADIIATDASPLEDVTRLYPEHVTFVMKEGKAYKNGGQPIFQSPVIP
jgi:imidazolonepropionase-like amidohydrolase